MAQRFDTSNNPLVWDVGDLASYNGLQVKIVAISGSTCSLESAGGSTYTNIPLTRLELASPSGLTAGSADLGADVPGVDSRTTPAGMTDDDNVGFTGENGGGLIIDSLSCPYCGSDRTRRYNLPFTEASLKAHMKLCGSNPERLNRRKRQAPGRKNKTTGADSPPFLVGQPEAVQVAYWKGKYEGLAEGVGVRHSRADTDA